MNDGTFVRNLGHYAEPKWSIDSRTSTYRRWAAMKNRLKNEPRYANLTMDERWEDFENFVADMGECVDDLSLDRIDNRQGYNKDNCRWVTREQQARNRRNCIMVGELTLKEFALKHGIPYGTMYHRVKKMGLTPEEARNYRGQHEDIDI